jgi:hypothetical protein
VWIPRRRQPLDAELAEVEVAVVGRHAAGVCSSGGVDVRASTIGRATQQKSTSRSTFLLLRSSRRQGAPPGRPTAAHAPTPGATKPRCDRPEERGDGREGKGAARGSQRSRGKVDVAPCRREAAASSTPARTGATASWPGKGRGRARAQARASVQVEQATELAGGREVGEARVTPAIGWRRRLGRGRTRRAAGTRVGGGCWGQGAEARAGQGRGVTGGCGAAARV